MSDSLPAGTEPSAKRVRIDDEAAARNNTEVPMADHADTHNVSILEWLNKDCFQAVLSYLTTGDILRSATVSRQWREEILEYLRGYRFCFEFYHVPRAHFIPRLVGLLSPDESCDRRVMPFDMCHGDPAQLGDKIRELGPGIVSIVLDRLDGAILKIIAQNCPNLTEFMLAGMMASMRGTGHPSVVEPWNAQQSQAQADTFTFTKDVLQCIHNMKLKRITFLYSPIVPENTIAEFLKGDFLEEIIICRNERVNGSCLSGLRAVNLKSLRLNACNLHSTHLLPVADRLTILTTLDLSNNPPEFLLNVHLLLQRTPNLKHLMLNYYTHVDMGKELLEALCSLVLLKHLSMCWNQNVSDEWLEVLAAGCKSLHTLDIEIKESSNRNISLYGPRVAVVSARGIRALGRARSLVQLGLAGRADATAELPACVVGCPNLEVGVSKLCRQAWTVWARGIRALGRARSLVQLGLAGRADATAELPACVAGCPNLEVGVSKLCRQARTVWARGIRALGRARSLVQLGLAGRADATAELPACVAGCPNLEVGVSKLCRQAWTVWARGIRALGRARSLVQLGLAGRADATAELPACVAGCPNLEVGVSKLCRQAWTVWARGIRALGRARSLVQLGLAGRADATAELPACVAGCPNLESVDVRGCTLSSELLTAIANKTRGRHKPLTLRVARTAIARYDLVPEGLAFNFVDTPRAFRLEPRELGSIMIHHWQHRNVFTEPTNQS